MADNRNILNYVEENYESFSSAPFNEVDAVVLSWMAYLKYPKDVIKEKTLSIREFYKLEYFQEMFKNIYDRDKSVKLFSLLVANKRYRDIKVHDYVEDTNEENTKQFAAVCFDLDEDITFIAFRGTDSTFVGWEEDFNMGFDTPIPSQSEAVNYLSRVTKNQNKQLLIGGHSKGGNLAVYASCHAGKELQERILGVYSLDGPGFPEEEYKRDSYLRMKNKIHKIVPQNSIIGILMEYDKSYDVILSDEHSVYQHDPFTWQMNENNFIYVDKLSISGTYVDKALNKWIEGLDRDERKVLTEALFDIITAGDAKTTREFKENWQESMPVAFKKIQSMDKETRASFISAFSALLRSAGKSLPEMLRKEERDKE